MSDTSDNPSIGGMPRAVKRPDHVKAPEGWDNPPVPEPAPLVVEDADQQPGGRDPVRYGDWEKDGLAIDF